ncbi:MAG: hypothetical protein AAGJ40_09315 [Planctomycetota bacterium]
MKKNTPGGCLCCDCELSYRLWPNFYSPSQYHNILTVRDVTETHTDVVTRTRVYVGGALFSDNETGPVRTTARAVNSDVDTIDSSLAYGRFSHVFDSTTGAPVTGAETVTSGIVASGDYTTEQETSTVTVDGKIEIERRLTVKFNTSQEFNFGAGTVVSSHLRPTIAEHSPTELTSLVPLDGSGQPVVTLQWDIGGDLHAMEGDTALPADPSEFDTRFAAMTVMEPLAVPVGDIEMTSVLPTVDSATVTIMLYANEDNEGGELTTAKLSVIDRDDPAKPAGYDANPAAFPSYVDWNSNLDYEPDWMQHVERLSVNQWRYRSKVRSDTKYEFTHDREKLWNEAGRSLVIQLVDISDPMNETIFAEATFSASVGTVASASGTYPFTITATGTWGTRVIFESGLANPVFPGEGDDEIGLNFPIAIIARENWLELIPGGTVSYCSMDATYSAAPLAIAGTLPNCLEVRFEINAPDPQPEAFSVTNLRYPATGKNEPCPDGTCPDVEPYTVLEWTVHDVTVDGDSFADFARADYIGCSAAFERDTASVDFGLSYDSETGSSTKRVQYGIELTSSLFDPSIANRRTATYADVLCDGTVLSGCDISSHEQVIREQCPGIPDIVSASAADFITTATVVGSPSPGIFVPFVTAQSTRQVSAQSITGSYVPGAVTQPQTVSVEVLQAYAADLLLVPSGGLYTDDEKTRGFRVVPLADTPSVAFAVRWDAATGDWVVDDQIGVPDLPAVMTAAQIALVQAVGFDFYYTSAEVTYLINGSGQSVVGAAPGGTGTTAGSDDLVVKAGVVMSYYFLVDSLFVPLSTTAFENLPFSLSVTSSTTGADASLAATFPDTIRNYYNEPIWEVVDITVDANCLEDSATITCSGAASGFTVDNVRTIESARSTFTCGGGCVDLDVTYILSDITLVPYNGPDFEYEVVFETGGTVVETGTAVPNNLTGVVGLSYFKRVPRFTADALPTIVFGSSDILSQATWTVADQIQTVDTGGDSSATSTTDLYFRDLFGSLLRDCENVLRPPVIENFVNNSSTIDPIEELEGRNREVSSNSVSITIGPCVP